MHGKDTQVHYGKLLMYKLCGGVHMQPGSVNFGKYMRKCVKIKLWYKKAVFFTQSKCLGKNPKKLAIFPIFHEKILFSGL
jgi:hypothetical protein